MREPHANGEGQWREQSEALDDEVGGLVPGGAAQQPQKCGGRLTRRAAALQVKLLLIERPPALPKGASDAGRRLQKCHQGRSGPSASRRLAH